MTTREKIISLANGCGIHYRPTPTGTTEMWCWDNALETFYHKAQREAFERAAKFIDDNCAYGDTHILVKAIRKLIKE